ncbi:MAG: hypothetical protein ACON5F_01045 [Jejuia sp.]
MFDKKLYRYTNVELLDVIKNSKYNNLIEKAEEELQSRKLSQKEMEKIEVDYKQYKAFQESRKNTPLTTEEWLTFFFLPSFTPRPKGRDDHFSESEIERFKRYGFEKKFYQAQKVKQYGYVFWFVMVVILAFLVYFI